MTAKGTFFFSEVSLKSVWIYEIAWSMAEGSETKDVQ